MTRRQSNPSNSGGRGGTRMKQFGLKVVAIWFTPEQLAVIEKAAAKIGFTKTRWIRYKAVAAAEAETAPKPRTKARK